MKILVIAAVLVLSAPASATVLTTDEQRLAWFLPVARAAASNSPCTNREQISLHVDLSGYGDGHDLGHGDSTTCRVSLADGMSDYMFCAILTHELATHLAGQQHSDDPESIMHHDVPIDYTPCVVALPKMSRREQVQAMVAQFGQRLAAFHWTGAATAAIRVRWPRRQGVSRWWCDVVSCESVRP